MDIAERIAELKQKRRAVILAHNYQRPEVQDIADYVGDSLELSRLAAASSAEVILFCGVHFMAETAKILAPDKTVLEPDPNAGCPMANMITARELRHEKEKYPDAAVVCYVNSSADVKGESDVCCTSSNAVKIVRSFPASRRIIFVPDKNLGRHVELTTGRSLLRWQGFCPTHQRILPEFVADAKKRRPDALVVAHPECREDVLRLADHVASTSGIIKFCKETPAKAFVICTEIGLLHRLRKDSPDKEFHGIDIADCPNMKLNSLEKILWSLEDMTYEVTVPPAVADAARRALVKMMEIS